MERKCLVPATRELSNNRTGSLSSASFAPNEVNNRSWILCRSISVLSRFLSVCSISMRVRLMVSRWAWFNSRSRKPQSKKPTEKMIAKIVSKANNLTYRTGLNSMRKV